MPTPPNLLQRALRRGALGLLLALSIGGAMAYAKQARHGLGVTGLSRDVPWGLYISQFTFLVGIGASAATVLLPYYVHRQKAFARALVLGEVVAIVALVQALACIVVDLGQPRRFLNILLYPTPSSLMFWDALTLVGYLGLSTAGLLAALLARPDSANPWARRLALATIPWAIGIHVVTALIYAGLSARPAWMTAVLAPRFLATAFASGPALLVLLAGWLARARLFDIGQQAMAGLLVIMTYATAASVVLAGLEAFTALYSGVPEARAHLDHLIGLSASGPLVVLNALSWALLLVALTVLLVPALRRRERLTTTAAAAILASVLMDKGFCLIASGFVPSAFGLVPDYRPSWVEGAIVAGIYSGGALVFLLLRPLFVFAQASLPAFESSVHALAQPPSEQRDRGMAGVAHGEI